MSKRFGDRKCDHPDFSFFCADGNSPFVFVFDRRHFIEPTPEQLAVYRANQAIVEAHAGRMILQEWECAGENARFTKDDIQAAIESVLKANPDLEFHQYWNGEGAYSLSVGCKVKLVAERIVRHPRLSPPR
jgi:hypothetical protein